MHHATPIANGSYPLRQGLRLSQALLTLISCVVLRSFLQLESEGKLDSIYHIICLVEVYMHRLLLYVGLVSLILALVMCDYDEDNMCFTCDAYPDIPAGLMETASVLSGLIWPLASFFILHLTPEWPKLWSNLWLALYLTNAGLWSTSAFLTMRKLVSVPIH
ncbi:hypothetical protein DSO57_1030420 [Entomophthora muscae]|uniref:Uncharacterized protein n=1 Tax=Entomophthora muscae TaxID=34485 RepID=A0ACC2SDW9_9FUNG|nr:hypothetical protein DSO57_1030420 [Entomophthora muscae]